MTKITKEAKALLGKVPDVAITAQVEISKSGVARSRIRAGIEPSDPTKSGGFSGDGGREKPTLRRGA